MSTLPLQECDCFVAGTGMAGMSAALFAANRGLSVVQAGSTGEIIFASGLFDVLAVHPMGEQKIWDNPWEAMEALIADEPNHPYARLTREEVEGAYNELFDFLGEYGVKYRNGGERNFSTITPVGTIKHTWAVPETMWAGVEAFANNTPTLLVDFEGLREFSAVQIAKTLGDKWSALRTLRIELPPAFGLKPLLTGNIGQAMELSSTRLAMCELIKPHIGDAKAVGLPAVLGIYNTETVWREMEEALGVPVFEVPTLPASVPGLRLKGVLEGRIGCKGVELKMQRKALSVEPQEDGRYLVTIGMDRPEEQILAKGVILGTGRFLGGGLFAERDGIKETVMGLPVAQPESRHEWHQRKLFDPKGHGISQAGVEVDAQFRPVDENGKVLHNNVFAVGALVAHQDWMRQKCGVGIAVGAALKAVETLIANCR